MRKQFVAAAGVVIVLLVGVLVWPGQVLVGSSGKSSETGKSGSTGSVPSKGAAVPPAVVAVAQQLVTGSEPEQRAMLEPGLDQDLPAGALFPPGSTITLDAHGWHQAGDYAAIEATLREPGAPDARVEIGFLQVSGQWRVTFEEKVS
ncbi:MAG: hypothetical protein HOV83_18285 [Catenulispora sp.]|nr:hypothetical protein [Catenulispora sp.]